MKCKNEIDTWIVTHEDWLKCKATVIRLRCGAVTPMGKTAQCDKCRENFREKAQDSKLQCAQCGTQKVVVSTNGYDTVIVCRRCHHEEHFAGDRNEC